MCAFRRTGQMQCLYLVGIFAFALLVVQEVHCTDAQSVENTAQSTGCIMDNQQIFGIIMKLYAIQSLWVFQLPAEHSIAIRVCCA